MQKELKKIKQAAAIGLWGSVAVVIATACYILGSRYYFYQSAYTKRWMLIAGTVLAVLAVSSSLLTIRRRIPAIRQTDGVDARLRLYSQHIRSLYYSMLATVVIICLLTVVSSQSILLMLAMIATLVLVLAFPNMYRMKVEMGLNDEEMRSLFGDKYIADNEPTDEQE